LHALTAFTLPNCQAFFGFCYLKDKNALFFNNLKIKMLLRKKYAMLNTTKMKRKTTKLQNNLLKRNVLMQKVTEEL